ncbi:hypothetical protein [Hydrogenophaga sp.]|uniref:CIS tube protein n=1 Tax=Hydrogenophaga sp. TaxID=1904254 RepID=UPI003562FC1B
MSEQKLAIAEFKNQSRASEKAIKVHFNPATLQFTVSNTLAPAANGGGSRQFVSQTVAKLTMDLVFDTTASNPGGEVSGGEDVRTYTDRMVKLLNPFGPEGERTPPVVELSWGAYKFVGTIEQYRETLELFSADGVPLRASVNLTMSNDSYKFESAKFGKTKSDPNQGTPAVQVPGGGGPSDVANAGGDPRAARAIAGLNASASLRFGGSASLLVEAHVSLGAPAAFASGSLSFGAGLGGGIGIGGGMGIGAGAGVGVGGSAGIASTAGTAFGGLRSGVSAGASLSNPQALLPPAPVSAGASFAPGGMAQGGGEASLGTQVAAKGSLSFEG